MQTILILGGFGFIGSNVLSYIDEYLFNEYQVVLFDKYKTHHQGLSFNCIKRVYSGDFSDDSYIDLIFSENKIDFVLHLLSSTVPSTSNNAQYDVESNLIPTLKLLNIMKHYEVKDIIYMSSGGAIYGDYLQKTHNEEDAVYPKSSYGIVKLAIEKYLLLYSEIFGFKTLILRLSNPFGKYHYNDRQGIINIAIRKALNNEKLQIWGDGNGFKDYIFITDVCNIMFKLIKQGIRTNVINIASGSSYSINQIVEIIKNIIPSFQWEHINSSRFDVESFELDITKLKNILGNYKFATFEEGILETIRWENIRM